MIKGVGLDVTQCSRVLRVWARYGSRFEQRALHPAEAARLAELTDDTARRAFIGGRWAAKEAVYKAVGGFRLLFPEIEVVPASKGAQLGPRPGATLPSLPLAGSGPEVRLHGETLVAARAMGVGRVMLSISHDGDTAMAIALAIEAEPRR